MLIRRSQMQAFEEASMVEFEQRTIAFLRAHLSGYTRSLSDEALRDLVRLGTERAVSYELRNDLDILRYVLLLVVLSPAFGADAQTAWAARILTDPHLKSEDKLDAITERLRFAMAEE